MARPRSSTALDHLKVLDLTRVRAGPTCCRVLADFGADVIKIEAPAGVDPNAGMSGARHGYDMLNLHRNKRGLTMNLKKPEGRDLFLRMVRQADIVVENFRPDVKTRLGIDYETLSSVNPAIILASISGFGQTGPYAQRAGFDQIAQGMGGLMMVTGNPGQGPMRAGTAVADSSSGLNAAIGILVALTEREKSGKGQWVHTSLLESQIALMDFQAARYLVEGEVPPQAGNDHPYATPMGVIATSDGYLNLGVGAEGQWRDFCTAIGREDLTDHPDFATMEDRYRNRAACWDLLAPIFAVKTTPEWLEIMEAHGVPAGPIYSVDEMFADAHVQHTGIAQTVRHHARGETTLIGQPVTLSRTPASLETSAPDLGEHSVEVLMEFGLETDEIAALREAGTI
ncbi:MAG: CoA transferase [Pseudomonadota bacterium]